MEGSEDLAAGVAARSTAVTRPSTLIQRLVLATADMTLATMARPVKGVLAAATVASPLRVGRTTLPSQPVGAAVRGSAAAFLYALAP